jgi:hypothetical protein
MALYMSFLPLELANLGAYSEGMSIAFILKVHANHPDGALDLSQRFRLTAMLIAARWTARRRKSPRTSEIVSELENPAIWRALEAPDERLAAYAWELARAHQPAWVVNHGLRTYAWGQVFGVIAGLSPDRGALFAAAMLHDAGLTPVAATPPEHCFAIRSARYARRALEGETDGPTLDVVEEAIARHLDFQVELEDGVEAHLLQAGAMADVLGRNLGRIPKPVRQHVLSVHPRIGMKEALCRCMVRESVAAPHSRVACYVKHIDFVNLIRQSPFDE